MDDDLCCCGRIILIFLIFAGFSAVSTDSSDSYQTSDDDLYDDYDEDTEINDYDDEYEDYEIDDSKNSYSDEESSQSDDISDYDSGTSYVGSINSNKFHDPSCTHAHKIKESNKISFSSREDALDSNYESCAICNP